MVYTVFNAACAEILCQRANKRIKASGKWCSCSDFGLVVSALHNTVQILKKRQWCTICFALFEPNGEGLAPSSGHKHNYTAF